MEKIAEVQKMQPMYVSIQQKETGNRIKSLLKQNGYTVKDIQGAMGFENPQAVYKWLSGRSLPSIDNFIILSRLLHTSIEDILVIDGDIVSLWSCYLIFYKKVQIAFRSFVRKKPNPSVNGRKTELTVIRAASLGFIIYNPVFHIRKIS